MNDRNKTKQLTTAALLLALHLVLSQTLAIKTPLLKISFGFMPLAMAGIVGGVPMAVAVAVTGDLLGVFLFPQVAGFYPGFTLSAALTGLTYGVFLHSKKGPIEGKKNIFIRSLLAVVIIGGPISVGMTSFWLTQLYGVEMVIAGMPGRISYNLMMGCVKLAVLPALFLLKDRLDKRTVTSDVPA